MDKWLKKNTKTQLNYTYTKFMIKEILKLIIETKYYIFVHYLYFILECYRLQSTKLNSISMKNIALNVENYIWTLRSYKYIYMSKMLSTEYSQELCTYFLPLKGKYSKSKTKI